MKKHKQNQDQLGYHLGCPLRDKWSNQLEYPLRDQLWHQFNSKVWYRLELFK